MPVLNVHLTDGFADDHVIVSVDGTKVFDRADVTTNKLLGTAASLPPVDVAADKAEITLDIPEKGFRGTVSVDLAKGSHVPIALDGMELRHAVMRKIGFA